MADETNPEVPVAGGESDAEQPPGTEVAQAPERGATEGGSSGPNGNSTEPEVTVTAAKSIEKEEMVDAPLPTRRTESASSNLSTGTDGESANPDLPMAPKSSRLSYDGPGHYQHKEAKAPEISEALDKLVEDVVKENAEGSDPSLPPPVVKAKHEKTYAFSARDYDEKKIMAFMQIIPPRHDYSGYVFSSQSARPFGVTDYFLPTIPQPTPRKHIAIQKSQVPNDVLHCSMKDAPKGLLPLSSVHLKWRSNPRFTVYTLTDLYAYLTRFGPIEGIYQRSPNSAIVIFCELTSARECVKCPELGLPWDILVATWCEPRMHNQGYMSNHIRMEEHNNMLDVNGPQLKQEQPTGPAVAI